MKMGAYWKVDLAMAYGVDPRLFEKWIEPIKAEIGWINGKRQKFPPKVIARIVEFLGEPA